MKIGNIHIETPIFLAPMAGVTDYPFRILCKEMGAGIVYSEFVSADGIIRENSKTLSASSASNPLINPKTRLAFCGLILIDLADAFANKI